MVPPAATHVDSFKSPGVPGIRVGPGTWRRDAPSPFWGQPPSAHLSFGLLGFFPFRGIDPLRTGCTLKLVECPQRFGDSLGLLARHSADVPPQCLELGASPMASRLVHGAYRLDVQRVRHVDLWYGHILSPRSSADRNSGKIKSWFAISALELDLKTELECPSVV